MDKHLASYPSHLFTLRIWQEELGNGRSEWRGQVQFVASGETRYFREWAALIAHLIDLLPISTGELQEPD